MPPTGAPDLSAHYERIVIDRQLKAGRALVAELGIERGQHVLELGCGTGLLSEHLADCVGHAGDVLGLDPLPLRVSIAHQKSRHNLRFQVGNARELTRFQRGSFDAICLNHGLHTLPEKLQPLREFLRLLKPGGRLGIVTHSKDHLHPMQTVQRAVLASEPYARHPLPPEAREYPVSQAELLNLLREAGFADEARQLKVEAQPDVIVHATADAAIEFAQASAWGRFLGHLPEPLRAQARADIVAGLERLRLPEGIRHNGVRLIAIACKPVGSVASRH